MTFLSFMKLNMTLNLIASSSCRNINTYELQEKNISTAESFSIQRSFFSLQSCCQVSSEITFVPWTVMLILQKTIQDYYIFATRRWTNHSPSWIIVPLIHKKLLWGFREIILYFNTPPAGWETWALRIRRNWIWIALIR